MRIRRPRPTVRLRLAITYTALFVITGAALLGVIYVLIQHRERGPSTAAQIICRRSVTGQLNAKASGVITGPPAGAVTLSPAVCAQAVGTFYYNSSSGSASGGGVVPAPTGGASPVTGPTAAAVRQLTATVVASQAHILESFKIGSAIALGLITIVSFGLSWWIAGRVLRPVHRITDAARRLSEQTLHRRINLQGPDDELKELADTFDAMLARLEGAFNSQRRFVANASHELRTPLATERILIDEALANRSAQPKDFRSILEQLRVNSEETERLVDALLVLARSERGIERWSDVDLAGTAESALAAAGPQAALKGVEIRSNLVPVVVKGDRGLLDRLIGNVVENGLRHNWPGGWVEVTTRRAGSRAFLDASNTGPVLDEATVATLIEPFRRAGPDRSTDDGGFGLGLSIVDAVVHAHRGSMTLRPRPGGGLVVRVELRVADAGDPGVGPSADGWSDDLSPGPAVESS
jgi:signal transduction histidine kinase